MFWPQNMAIFREYMLHKSRMQLKYNIAAFGKW
jgi:hypothetical protein